MSATIAIGRRDVGPGKPVYIVAELSANHRGDFDEALRILHAAREAGADAVKAQTYTADTMTLPSRAPGFRIGAGTVWEGRYLHDLYREAATPWDWLPRLKKVAEELGLDFFATAFDASAVAFLEGLGVSVHKVSSFELVDLPLIETAARAGKPLILSTGMATREEIEEAVAAARRGGARDLLLLKCTSAYPAPPEEMNLRTIPDLAARLGVPVGLSDHTLGTAIPAAAVALGACLIEKHLTLSRAVPGPDSGFSLEPAEFREMVEAVRAVEKALGEARYGPAPRELASLQFRRSLFVVEDVREGEAFTGRNVRSLRPGSGLPPRSLPEVIGRKAARDLPQGTPLQWRDIV